MKPSIGRIVHYKLSGQDAQDVNRRRHDFSAFTRTYTRPDIPGNPGATGHVGHFGNAVKPGDIFPAMIVKVHPPSQHFRDMVNLQVHLDGNDAYWATSRHEGNELGEWKFPEIKTSEATVSMSTAGLALTSEQVKELVNEIQKQLLIQAKRSPRSALKPNPPPEE